MAVNVLRAPNIKLPGAPTCLGPSLVVPKVSLDRLRRRKICDSKSSLLCVCKSVNTPPYMSLLLFVLRSSILRQVLTDVSFFGAFQPVVSASQTGILYVTLISHFLCVRWRYLFRYFLTYCYQHNRCSDWAIGCWIEGSIHGRVITFSVSLKTSIQPAVRWVPVFRVHRLGREHDHSHHCSIEVKNPWSYTSTPSYLVTSMETTLQYLCTMYF